MGRQRVDHRDADTVQAAGDLVAAVTELGARVQHGERQGDSRDLLLGMLFDRDAAPLSTTWIPPSGRMRTRIVSQYPASASSTALSTTS